MASSEKTPLHSKETEGEESEKTFSSKFGLVCTCLGCAIGTGNVWRFPRVLAAASGEKGGLCFLLVWLLVLVLWSIPMLVIEYGVGRYTRKAVTRSFQLFIGTRSSWCGFWITAVNFMISGYYAVIAGWCIYYVFYFIVYPLPTTYDNSSVIFDSFAQESKWPVFTQAIVIVLTGALLVKGVRIIERANLFLAPTLLIILIALFIWAALRPNASRGLSFLFSPDWETLKDPLLWVEAASQNAFDTGAGSGVFLSYAAYMSRKHPAMKLAVGIPLANNIVSLLCGMLIFSTVFSSLSVSDPNITNSEVLEVLKTSGPGSTGLTFIWLPVLLETSGTAGRIMAVLFFICLVFAAISSAMATVEMIVHFFCDFGIPRTYAVLICLTGCFLVGLGSALNLDFLTNQDSTWGFALLLCGLMMISLVIIFGTGRFRRYIVNEHGIGDWKLPKIWEYDIKFLAPVLTATLLLWWVINSILTDDNSDGYTWYQFGPASMLGILLQWLLVFLIVVGLNITLEFLQPAWFTTTKIDPANPTEMENHSAQSEKDASINPVTINEDKP